MQVLKVTATHRAAYLWQQDAFRLAVVVPSSSAPDGEEEEEPPHLHGLVRVADAVEDQWFIVWLLCLATAHPTLAAKGLTARVADSDGDFLLIEGSAACPHAWLEGPEEGAHRTWIRDGTARFIADDLCPPSASNAACYVGGVVTIDGRVAMSPFNPSLCIPSPPLLPKQQPKRSPSVQPSTSSGPICHGRRHRG